jgi:hypothetical protein
MSIPVLAAPPTNGLGREGMTKLYIWVLGGGGGGMMGWLGSGEVVFLLQSIKKCLFEITQINILAFKMSQEFEDPEVKILLKFQERAMLTASTLFFFFGGGENTK